MKGGVLDQGDPLVPAIDVDQGGLGGGHATRQTKMRADMVLCDTCFSACVVGSVLPPSWRHSSHAVVAGSRCGCLLVEEAAARSCAVTGYCQPPGPAMDSGMASATAKILHKVLPDPHQVTRVNTDTPSLSAGRTCQTGVLSRRPCTPRCRAGTVSSARWSPPRSRSRRAPACRSS